jgi:hypothetical protein
MELFYLNQPAATGGRLIVLPDRNLVTNPVVNVLKFRHGIPTLYFHLQRSEAASKPGFLLIRCGQPAPRVGFDHGLGFQKATSGGKRCTGPLCISNYSLARRSDLGMTKFMSLACMLAHPITAIKPKIIPAF